MTIFKRKKARKWFKYGLKALKLIQTARPFRACGVKLAKLE